MGAVFHCNRWHTYFVWPYTLTVYLSCKDICVDIFYSLFYKLNNSFKTFCLFLIIYIFHNTSWVAVIDYLICMFLFLFLSWMIWTKTLILVQNVNIMCFLNDCRILNNYKYNTSVFITDIGWYSLEKHYFIHWHVSMNILDLIWVIRHFL